MTIYHPQCRILFHLLAYQWGWEGLSSLISFSLLSWTFCFCCNPNEFMHMCMCVNNMYTHSIHTHTAFRQDAVGCKAVMRMNAKWEHLLIHGACQTWYGKHHGCLLLLLVALDMQNITGASSCFWAQTGANYGMVHAVYVWYYMCDYLQLHLRGKWVLGGSYINCPTCRMGLFLYHGSWRIWREITLPGKLGSWGF